MIQPGQIYRSADPRDGHRKPIRITAYDGSNRAHVVDAHSGKRPRQILVSSLHDTPTTRDGKPRRSGYIRVQAETPSEPMPEPAPETTMTRAEFEDQQHRLGEAIETARQDFNRARQRYDQLCEEALMLRYRWRDQQAKETP